MKKLALALVCLVSVAFFASCTKPVENPEPSIAIMTGDNYVYDGQTIDLYQSYLIGFRVASNSQTSKDLASFRLETKIYEGTEESRPTVYDTTYTISGSEYVFEEEVYFEIDAKDLVGKVEYIATVTDVDGKYNSDTVTLNLNLAAQPLTAVDFEWYRLGNTQEGLAQYGLYWDRNARSPYAEIKPLDNVQLYKWTADCTNNGIWESTVTDQQKASLFSEGAMTMTMYKKVDVNLANGTYDDVIGTRMPDGTLHLIHVTSHRVGVQQSAGVPTWIYGQAK